MKGYTIKMKYTKKFIMISATTQFPVSLLHCLPSILSYSTVV